MLQNQDLYGPRPLRLLEFLLPGRNLFDRIKRRDLETAERINISLNIFFVVILFARATQAEQRICFLICSNRTYLQKLYLNTSSI